MNVPARARLAPHLLAAACATGLPAAAQDDGNPALRAAELQPARGVVIHYDLNSHSDPAGRLEGVVRDGWGEWRTQLRVDPALAIGERVTRLETRWQADATGGAPGLVVGDTITSGGGWSRPVRIGGIRLGRETALPAGFDVRADARIAGSAALPANSIAADAGHVIDAMHTPGTRPEAAAWTRTGYELEAGRLRIDAGTVQERYADGYAAAAWRTALAAGVTAQARGEWTATRVAAGLELARRFDDRGSVRAVLAQSEAHNKSGLRRGLSLVRNSEGVAWTLAWDDFDRGFTPLALAPGEAEARTRLQAGAAYAFPGGLDAGVTYGRQSTWGAAPAQVLGLQGRLALPQRGTLSMDYSLRAGEVHDHRLGLTLAIPLTR